MIFARLHAWRGHRQIRRRVRRIAQTHSMVYLTEHGPSLTPDEPRRGWCHSCGAGRFTARDPYSGVRCCDHCGAPADQIPGATPRDGIAASPAHLTGDCECRSVGRVDLDARERERAWI